MPFTLYDEVSEYTTLARAWQSVHRSGMRSQSERTRSAIKSFEADLDTRLKRISSELKNREFNFGTARAAPIKRKGKAPRPLLVPEIPARLVQRALLEVLQRQESIAAYVDHPCSYGGLPGKKRADVILHACRAIANGASYVIRSDIPGFFTRILRLDVLDRIRTLLPDDSLEELIDSATSLEIGNVEQIQAFLHLFPEDDVGVAQGCCLSPLFGNIYLRGFDDALNSGSAITLRYIDDFLILGKDRESAMDCFREARKILRTLNLDAYHPADQSGKASERRVKRGFEFLGCHIAPGSVEPSSTARAAFLERVAGELRTVAHVLQTGLPNPDEDQRHSLTGVLSRVSRMVRGWSEQYRFCNQSDAFKSVDLKIDRMVTKFLKTFFKQYKRARSDPARRRRLLGIWMTSHTSRDPILPLSAHDEEPS